jgi:hypothetical protein
MPRRRYPRGNPQGIEIIDPVGTLPAPSSIPSVMARPHIEANSVMERSHPFGSRSQHSSSQAENVSCAARSAAVFSSEHEIRSAATSGVEPSRGTLASARALVARATVLI